MVNWAAEQRARARTSQNGVAGLFAKAVAKESEKKSEADEADADVANAVGLEDLDGVSVSGNARVQDSREEDSRGDIDIAREAKANGVGFQNPGGAGAKRAGSGPAPAAKKMRTKHSAIARMFAERASADGKR